MPNPLQSLSRRWLYAVFVVPLLSERHWRSYIDRILLIAVRDDAAGQVAIEPASTSTAQKMSLHRRPPERLAQRRRLLHEAPRILSSSRRAAAPLYLRSEARIRQTRDISTMFSATSECRLTLRLY